MTTTPTAVAYRWDELECDNPMPLITRQRVIGKQAMISKVLLKKGCLVPTHQHENEQFAHIVSGRLRFILGDENSDDTKELIVSAGEILHLPSMVPHAAEALEDTVVLDVFSPPSETTGIDKT